jgi:hypothetical protein
MPGSWAARRERGGKDDVREQVGHLGGGGTRGWYVLSVAPRRLWTPVMVARWEAKSDRVAYACLRKRVEDTRSAPTAPDSVHSLKANLWVRCLDVLEYIVRHPMRRVDRAPLIEQRVRRRAPRRLIRPAADQKQRRSGKRQCKVGAHRSEAEEAPGGGRTRCRAERSRAGCANCGHVRRCAAKKGEREGSRVSRRR